MSWFDWLSLLLTGSSVLAVLLAVLGAVMTISYFLLPFALFGIKRQLRRLIAEQEKTNALLQERNPG